MKHKTTLTANDRPALRVSGQFLNEHFSYRSQLILEEIKKDVHCPRCQSLHVDIRATVGAHLDPAYITKYECLSCGAKFSIELVF